MNSEDRIMCVARIRPVPDESDEMDTERVVHTSFTNADIFDSHLIVSASNGVHPTKNFKLDNIFDVNTTQDDIFQDAVEPLLVNAIDEGYNACICTYGQTGSGKTHTMLGIDLWSLAEEQGFEFAVESFGSEHTEEFGIVPRSLVYLFKHQNVLSVSVSYIEIFNEKVYDLLDTPEDTRTENEIREGKPPPRCDLDIREGGKKAGIVIPNLTCVDVINLSQAFQVLWVGAKNRSIAATNANEHSSRSHTIFTICIDSVRVIIDKTGENKTILKTSSKISLVDLAGSEKWSSSQLAKLESDRVKESIAINKSLSALGKCVAALSSQTQGNRNIHVPYRDSKLTRYLQDSLGGNSRTLFCVTLNPTYGCIEETVSTLQFADRAMKVQVHAVANCIRTRSTTNGENNESNNTVTEKLIVENNVLLYIIKSLSVRFTENEIKETVSSCSKLTRTNDVCHSNGDSIEKNILQRLDYSNGNDDVKSVASSEYSGDIFGTNNVDTISSETVVSGSIDNSGDPTVNDRKDPNLVGEFFKRMTKMESSLNSQTEQFAQTRQLFKDTNDGLKAELTKANADLEAMRIGKESDNKTIKELRMNLRVEKNKNADLSKELQNLKEVSRRGGRIPLSVSKPSNPNFPSGSTSSASAHTGKVSKGEKKIDDIPASVGGSTKSASVQKSTTLKQRGNSISAQSTNKKSMTDVFSDEMSLLEGMELPKTDRVRRFSVGSINIMPKVQESQIPSLRKKSIIEGDDNITNTGEIMKFPSSQLLKNCVNFEGIHVNLMENLSLSDQNDDNNGEDNESVDGIIADDHEKGGHDYCPFDNDEKNIEELVLSDLESAQLQQQQPLEDLKVDITSNGVRDNIYGANDNVRNRVAPKPLWKDVVDKKSGRTYYYNRVSKVSQWIRPSDYEMDMLKVINGQIVVVDEDSDPPSDDEY